MAMKQGEKYQCTNPDCGCEITVTRGSEAEEADRPPTCCCGEEMIAQEKPARRASASAGRAQR